jgi:two-component system, response regulator PdtaR
MIQKVSDSAGSAVGTAPRVLVVEDETLIRMALVDDLMRAGYIVIDACDADQAMQFLMGSPSLDLMVTDVRMPGSMDGVALAIAARKRLPSLKIIVISGHLQAPPELTVADAFLPKPYSPDALVSVVASQLNRTADL